MLPWRERLEGIDVIGLEELMPSAVPTTERVSRRIDIELDKRIGFYPLAIRHSLRQASTRAAGRRDTRTHSSIRTAPAHCRGGEPRVAHDQLAPLEQALRPTELLRRMRAECDAVVFTNPQTQASTPFLAAARRLDLPAIGYIASWDHPVGKGVVSPYLDAYVVQNETMREDLRRFHEIDPARVTVTGWPQTDVYHRQRSRETYEELLGRLGLPDRQAGRPLRRELAPQHAIRAEPRRPTRRVVA